MGAKQAKTKIGRWEDDSLDHIETNQNTNVQPLSSWSHLQPALRLNGSEDYLQFPSSPLLDEISQELTLMAWIYPERWGDQRIFCKSVAGCDDAGYGLDTHESVLRYLGGGHFNCARGNSRIELSQWVHVGLTFKAREPEGFKLFVRRQIDFSITPETGMLRNELQLTVGLPPVGMPYSGYFQGQMAHLSVWNKALTPEQFSEYSCMNLSALDPADLRELGAVAVLSFEDLAMGEHGEVLIKDLSGNNLHAKYHGSVPLQKFEAEKITHVMIPDMKPIKWTPSTHRLQPKGFRDAVKVLLLLALRDRNGDEKKEGEKGRSYFHTLPKELYIIFEFMSQ